MNSPIYPDFLEDEEQYAASEGLWRNVFNEILDAIDSSAMWEAWRPRAYANGTAFPRDGNPIFDARSLELRRAVQIIQWPCKTGEVEISAWLRELPNPEEEESLPMLELTLNLSLSEQTLALARALLQKWVDHRTTVEAITREIAALTTRKLI
jgi:hypothetical protein